MEKDEKSTAGSVIGVMVIFNIEYFLEYDNFSTNEIFDILELRIEGNSSIKLL